MTEIPKHPDDDVPAHPEVADTTGAPVPDSEWVYPDLSFDDVDDSEPPVQRSRRNGL